MHALTGTWRLVRLALRRDRIKLPIIILALMAMVGPSIASVLDVYGSSPKEQVTYASTTAPSVVGRVFNGPINGPELGAIAMNETFLFTAIALAFVCTLTVVRHTRQNEEAGSTELIGSGVVSLHAPLAAAVIVAAGASLVFSCLMTLSLIASDLPVAGSVGAGIAMAGVGLVFTGVAAVAAQLADGSRGANSFSALAIGVAFLLRAAGDGMGKLTQNGMAVDSVFLSWLSPLGWAQQVHPYTQANWWIFGLLGGLFVILIGMAIALMARRDIGSGIFATRPGPARAKTSLLSAYGLARRLQGGVLKGWAIAVIVLAGTYGLVIKEFEKMLTDNEQLRETFAQISSNPTDAFLGFMISFMALTITGYVVQSLLRMRSEEGNGQLESVLGTAVSRTRWMLSHIVYVALGTAILAMLSALSMGISYIVSSGVAWSELWTIIGATLVQSVAAVTFAGFVVAIFSLLPRLSVAVAWGTFSACVLILQLGVILKLPQWFMNFSPFGHVPMMPGKPFELVPPLSLLAIGIALTIAGIAYFRHRDITTA